MWTFLHLMCIKTRFIKLIKVWVTTVHYLEIEILNLKNFKNM